MALQGRTLVVALSAFPQIVRMCLKTSPHQVRHSVTRRRTDENRSALSLAVGLGVARAPQACTTKEADTVPIAAHSTTGRPATRPARKPPQQLSPAPVG